MDRRTRVEKLRAMAADTSSPHEAAIARERLAAMGAAEAPRPVAAVPDPFGKVWAQTSTTSGSFGFTVTFRKP